MDPLEMEKEVSVEYVSYEKAKVDELVEFSQLAYDKIKEQNELLELKEMEIEDLKKQLEPQPLGIDLSNVNLKSILGGSEEANNFIR